MKSFLTATAILLALGAPSGFAQPGNNTGGASTDSTSSGGQYTGDGIAGTANGSGTGGTATTANNSQKSPDYDSTAAKRRNSPNAGQSTSSTARTMSQGPNGTPLIRDGRDDTDQGSYQPKTPP